MTCLAIAVSNAGGLNEVLVIYQGPCEKSKRLDVLLHLLINIVSTAILGSANYFMHSLIRQPDESTLGVYTLG